MFERRRLVPVAFAAALILGFTACEQAPTEVDVAEEIATTFDTAPLLAKKGGGDDPVQAMMAGINAQLEADGADYQLSVVEYYTSGEGEEIGRTVVFRDVGNKQVADHFVPNDSRRTWSGPGSAITWVSDLFDGSTTSGLSPAETAAAIRNAMGTWDSQTCSTIPLNDLGDAPVDIGFVQFFSGSFPGEFGGAPFILADYTHGGFLPGAFFDLIVPGGSSFILGATATLTFVGTDVDNNEKVDVAFRETYYNDAVPWAIGSTFDVETIAFHEAGHGLSQGHFGKAFLTDSNGKGHFAPRAAMNAGYSGVQQSPSGSDVGGHCSIWAQWPNN